MKAITYACIELHTHTHAHTRMCNKFQCMIDSIKLWNVKWAGKQLKCTIQNKKTICLFHRYHHRKSAAKFHNKTWILLQQYGICICTQ